MRKFRVTIGGITYNVDVEEVGAAGGAAPAAYAPAPAPVYHAPAPAPAPAAAASAPAPAPVAAPAPAPAPAKAPAKAAAPTTAGGEVVKAPLPGVINDIKVKVGDQVQKGAVLLVLEAMKMENDITSPVAGTVKEIATEKGAAVGLGDPLVVIG